jgi:hypothetical protein
MLLTVLSFISFFRKAVSGKRVINIEQYDVLLGIILTLVCIYSAITRENAKITDYIVIISLFMGYTLASNIITNRRLADCISNGLVIATLPISVYFNAIRIIAFAKGSPLPAPPAVLAVSAVVSAILSIRLIKHAAGFVKGLYTALLVFYTVSVGVMLSPMLAIALGLGLVTTALYRAGRYFSLPVTAVCLAVALAHFLPDYLRTPVFSALSIESRTLVASLLSSIPGAIILAFVALLLLIRIRHRIVYSVFFEGTHLTGISVGYAGSVVALLMILSTLPSMLSNFTLYLLLSVFGMGSAALRVAKSESDKAELYFEDSKSTDSSTVNILIH